MVNRKINTDLSILDVPEKATEKSKIWSTWLWVFGEEQCQVDEVCFNQVKFMSIVKEIWDNI